MHRGNTFLKNQSIPDDETFVPVELESIGVTAFGAGLAGKSVVVYFKNILI